MSQLAPLAATLDSLCACAMWFMCSDDMYYVGGRGNAAIAARPDCAGMGPTSTTPWAEMSMQWWAARVPKEKLVMGLPAYSNDYSALPGWGGGNGTQAGVGPPTSAEDMCNATLTPNATQVRIHLSTRLLAPFCTKNAIIFQDRLGTNIGKALKKRDAFSCRRPAAMSRPSGTSSARSTRARKTN